MILTPIFLVKRMFPGSNGTTVQWRAWMTVVKPNVPFRRVKPQHDSTPTTFNADESSTDYPLPNRSKKTPFIKHNHNTDGLLRLLGNVWGGSDSLVCAVDSTFAMSAPSGKARNFTKQTIRFPRQPTGQPNTPIDFLVNCIKDTIWEISGGLSLVVW